VWLPTVAGVLTFRSGPFTDAVRAHFGEATPSLQPAAEAPLPPVEVPAPAEPVVPTTEGDVVPAAPETPPSPF